MALISCPDCGTRVSDLAQACPTCARPLALAPGMAARPLQARRRRVVRRLVLLSLAVMAGGLLWAHALRVFRAAAAPPPGSAAPPPQALAPTPPPAAPAAGTGMGAPAPAPATLPALQPAAEPQAAGSAPITSGTPVQPAQPASGPGGARCAHGAVVMSTFGSGDTQYWLFEPDQPRPLQAPVIVFLHGWGAMSPDPYRSWVDHLVHRGSIVIYPRYQASLLTRPDTFTANAIVALIAAYAELRQPGHVAPDLDRVASVGHSFGGVEAANLAALAAEYHLPAFKAVMCVDPGAKGRGQVYQDYARIPAGTLLLCVASAEDTIAGDLDARRIFREATAVAVQDKDYLLLRSDRHGQPPLVANHFAPVSRNDCARWFGFWKWFDGLTDAAFFDNNRNRAYALGDTPEQRFMGRWSDGQAVVEPLVTTTP